MSVAPTTSEKLADRYGRGRAGVGRRVLWVVGGLAAASFVGYLAWTTVAGAIASIDVDTTRFEIHDARSVTVHFQTTAQPDTEIACAVEAQDTEHGVVGWRIVSYPADAARTRTFAETVPTTAEATTGFVSRCWIP